ncbi:SERTA domain-containing protein 2-like [Anguilla anguilla]|uniref:SERTA domain-containing protein 2-like n=1 Tax=Anguilla anguilla TaxID=7936 RepID=UPI0015AC0B4E|nr:SERTA domain-containing protein 2-like [Anguilla anguilla]XP_035257002.1 SERTA domain-containing protein 2-like [Anguilla anguilla]
MLGKGAKRKLEEDEDGLEGKALASGGPADGPSKVSYTLQRQTIFNISLMKLYSQRPPPEPSLARRVLINNMLRRIQEELRWEGGPRPILFPPSAPPDDPADEGFREAQPAFGALSAAATAATPTSPSPQALPQPPPLPALPVSAPPDSCLTPASLLEDDAASFCTSPPPHTALAHPLLHHGLSRLPPASTALDDTGGLGPPAAENATTTTSSVTVAPHPLLAGSDSKDCSKTCSQKFEGLVSQLEGRAGVATKAESRLMDSLPPSGLDISPSSSSGFLTDLALDDILFADIDTSMYDFDPCTTTTAGVTASKMAPMVMSDDLFKTLSPYGGTPTSAPPAQPFKMDLTELDHIMEVLVGS